MKYNIHLGSLADDAISEFSKANATKEVAHYEAFLQRSTEFCQAVRKIYGRAVETDVLNTMPNAVAEFMRAVIKTQPPSPTASAKLAAINSLEELLQTIRSEGRPPSDGECLRIAKTIHVTSAADPS